MRLTLGRNISLMVAADFTDLHDNSAPRLL